MALTGRSGLRCCSSSLLHSALLLCSSLLCFALLCPGRRQYKGTELLLLGVKHSPREILGADELKYMEQMAEEEEEAAHSKKDEHKKIERGQQDQRAQRPGARIHIGRAWS